MPASFSEVSSQQVAVATDLSAAFGLGQYNAGSIQFPAALDNSLFTVNVSNDGVVFDGLRTAAGALVNGLPCEAGALRQLPAEAFAYKFAKVKFPDAEGSPRVLTIFLKG